MTDPVPLHTPDRQAFRHAELVSASILQSAMSVQVEEWTLKQVQGDAHSATCKGWQTQPDRQIVPVRIFGFDQVDLPLAMPALQLFLSGDGACHVTEHLEADQRMNVIPGRKPFGGPFPMLPESRDQVAGDSDVKGAVCLAGKDVDTRGTFELHGAEFAVEWTLKQVQGDGITELQ
jgi:hypothetical protein